MPSFRREPLRIKLPSEPGPIDLDALAKEEELKAQDPSLERMRGGFRLTKWLLLLIAAIIAAIGLFAWQTYPSVSATAKLVTDKAALFDNHQAAIDDWFSQVKDLVQLLVVSLLIPLLATLIGYIFGQQHGSGTTE